MSFEIKINRIVKGFTKTSERKYLQIYIDIIDNKTGFKVQEHSFFASGIKIPFWLEQDAFIIESRDEIRLKEIKKEMKKIESRLPK